MVACKLCCDKKTICTKHTEETLTMLIFIDFFFLLRNSSFACIFVVHICKRKKTENFPPYSENETKRIKVLLRHTHTHTIIIKIRSHELNKKYVTKQNANETTKKKSPTDVTADITRLI